ncbi:MAG: FemAB family XrtA/PEP-CTERM system-associated protein [Parvularculaceae bacterium]
MSLAIADFVEADRDAWRAYVNAHPEATLFHDLRWSDAVAAGYGHSARHLTARRAGAIVGVLPLTYVDAPLLGRSLISVAFAVGGGVLADDQNIASLLAARALDLGRELGVYYVELRGGAAPGAGYAEKTGVYAAFEKELPGDVDAIAPWLPRRRRAEVRKALRIDETGEASYRVTERADDFYKVYASAVRNLGTPVMPKKFLAALKENFGDEAEIDIVSSEGKPVAGLISFWRRDRVMPYYVGADRKARDLRAFDYLYYQLMRKAADRGVRVFDFGRSKVGSTHYATKTHWGFEAKPVSYHVGLVRAKDLPNVNPNNPKFAAFVSLWRRMPLPLANALGPVLARNFP